MKILLSTPVFKPMVGGIETLALNTANHLTRRGHEVIVVTPTPSGSPDEDAFTVVRNAPPKKLLELVRWSELVFCNGASLYIAPYTLLVDRPVVMRHDGYQVSSLDGAGWYKGQKAPLQPLPSFFHHLKNGRALPAVRGILKVGALRLFANRVVDVNVAISDWMIKRNPVSNQVRIYNPFPITKFSEARNTTGEYKYDFFFLGRLISEKGVDVLIDAFIKLQSRSENRYRLCVIGDGPERSNLEKAVNKGKQTEAVHFAGMKTGDSLIELLRSCQIAVLPSSWEEPFGGVVTELMAAGKNVIVSRDGALSELVGDGGLAVPNGDSAALSQAMEKLITDPAMQARQKEYAKQRLADFDEDQLISSYEELFIQTLNSKRNTPN